MQRLTLKPKLAFGRRIPGGLLPARRGGVLGPAAPEGRPGRAAAVFGRDDDVFAHVLTFWRSDVWG